MYLVLSCSCLCTIYWSQVLSREWKCSWSSAERRCSNYIWVVDNSIAYKGSSYMRDFMVFQLAWGDKILPESGGSHTMPMWASYGWAMGCLKCYNLYFREIYCFITAAHCIILIFTPFTLHFWQNICRFMNPFHYFYPIRSNHSSKSPSCNIFKGA